MKPIQELQVWIAENFHRELSLRILADRVAMSVRSFERVFRREVGKAPAQYVWQVRVEAARRQLERSDRGLDQVVLACGFPRAERLRRAFVRVLKTTPRAYRGQFVRPAGAEGL